MIYFHSLDFLLYHFFMTINGKTEIIPLNTDEKNRLAVTLSLFLRLILLVSRIMRVGASSLFPTIASATFFLHLTRTESSACTLRNQSWSVTSLSLSFSLHLVSLPELFNQLCLSLYVPLPPYLSLTLCISLSHHLSPAFALEVGKMLSSLSLSHTSLSAHWFQVEAVAEAFENLQLKMYGIKAQVHETPEKKKRRQVKPQP